jgi:hypothetical protein
MKSLKLFFSLILVIFFYTINVSAFFSKNELEACKDAYNWLQKKIDKGKNVAQYKSYQNTVANYYQMALQRRNGMERIAFYRSIGAYAFPTTRWISPIDRTVRNS